MIVNPFNPNSVVISTVPVGCCRSEFDSNYPIQLNGIINRNEFQESINKINATIASKKGFIILTVAFLLCVICAIALFAVGAFIRSSLAYVYLLLFGFSGLFCCIAICCTPFGCCLIQSRRTARLNKVIAEESAKYSMRPTTPCSWRLGISSMWGGRYSGYRNRHLNQTLVIDIGGNNVNNYSQPPPYYPLQVNHPYSPFGTSNQTNCPQCGTPRQSSSMNYCSSCGQQFNKF